MGFLRRVKVPDELPDLAIEDGSVVSSDSKVKDVKNPDLLSENRKDIIEAPVSEDVTSISSNKAVAGEDYLEFQNKSVKKIEGGPESFLEMSKADRNQSGFFNQVLENINEEIEDMGKLEDWYKDKFANQDVVSGMKDYWEGNKADMIIRSFGSEYKKRIATKVKRLQELENEWRSIYFQLVKKEEEMKKEEKELKETVSEFVEICKRRKGINNEEEEKTQEGDSEEVS